MRLERWRYLLPLRWRSIARPGDVERDLDDEIRYHLEEDVEDLVTAGIDPAEAWRTARRKFGSLDLAKEQCRDARGVQLVDSVRQDVRYAARTLRRNPAFALVAALTLALGIGANSAVFSLVDGILLAPLPYASPGCLVHVEATYPNGAFAAMRDEVRTLDVAAYAEGHAFTLTGNGEPARVTGARMSAELFSILGVKPALGRWLRRGEDVSPADRYVAISHRLWLDRFQGDPSIVGKSIRLDDVPREVIAVMPASFEFPSARTALWVPLGLDSRNVASYWAGDFMPVVGRLRPGATRAGAEAELGLFQSRVTARFPWRMPADWNRQIAVVSLQEALVGDVRPRLLMLMAAVGLVLVVACANVANLNLSRAIAREREVAVRTAIGASPRRIARQLLTESAVLASLGAVLGLAVAREGLAIIRFVLPADTPRLAEVGLNWRVVAFTGIVTVLTACAFGLAPAQRALRLRLRAAMEASGRGTGGSVATRLRSALAGAQVACAVLLVVIAGLLARSLWGLSRVDPGFSSDGVVTARISPGETVCGTPERCLAFYRHLEERLPGLTGVQGAALVNTVPLTGAVAKRSIEVEGYTPPPSRTAPLFWLNVITPDYFRTMAIRLESGRLLARPDLSGQPAVAVVTASTARRFWPGRVAVGRHIRFVGETGWREVVGVVADVRADTLTRNIPDFMDGSVYVPLATNATMEDGRVPAEMTVVLRTALEPTQVGGMVRRLVGEAGGSVAVDRATTLRSVVAGAMGAPAATTSLLVTLAGLALLLGSIGVYGVLSFLVSRRTRDLGIRLALGADPRDIVWLVVKEGGRLYGAGVLVGIAAAYATTRWMASQFYGVSPTDLLTYVAAATVVGVVTLVACYIPARRAARVDPLTVLRDS